MTQGSNREMKIHTSRDLYEGGSLQDLPFYMPECDIGRFDEEHNENQSSQFLKRNWMGFTEAASRNLQSGYDDS